MSESPERIKDYFESKTANITRKIDKTPMEKFFVFFLVLITISALVLGYFQFKKNIESPLYSSYLREKRGELRESYQIANINLSTKTEDISKLQNQDSDLDGLSDYSEIYLYKTSAYLEDTDSDGVLDKQEIIAGSDPNCPEGQDCTLVVADQLTGFDGLEYSDSDNTNAAANFDLQTADLVDLQNQLLSGEVTLEELGIYDPQLQGMLEQVKSLQGFELDNVSTEDKTQATADLKQMTSQEIRQELIDRGIDESLLLQIDDQTLKQLFLDTLSTY
jgi:thrombospondin type 3 repeat protein